MYRDRVDAGRTLAEHLRSVPLTRPLILAIPRGGVVVGAALADALEAETELDVVLSRKLHAPGHPELALGAVAEDGTVVIDPRVNPDDRWLQAHLEHERGRELAEIECRKAVFRPGRDPAEVEGRTVIVVDDGVATGSTLEAALQTVRARRPLELIAAVPVGPPDRLASLAELCDRLICPLQPPRFAAVGQFYRDFRQVEDSEVTELLRAHSRRR